MTNNEKFERWAETEFPYLDLTKNSINNDYIDSLTIHAYLGWNAAKADSEREIVTLAKDNADLLIERDVALRTVDELQAHINKLREGFEAIIKMNASMIPLPVPNMQVSANHLPYLYDFQLKAKEALAATAAQSLKAHDDELIERCAKECEYAATPYRDADKFYICAEAVRALKGE